MNASMRAAVIAGTNAKNGLETRSAKLRQMLRSEELEFLMEAHNGLSARIVREAGFKGIWASGLSISAQFGVRDNNEAEYRFETLDMPALLNALIAGGESIEVLYVHGHWRGVNDLDELRQAVDFAHAQAPLSR